MTIIKSGDKFGMLTAIKFIDRDKFGQQRWLFKCDCGKKTTVIIGNVKRGNTKSCGCIISKRNYKHGMTNSKNWNSWVGMIQRCFDKKHKDYKNYGGRGIKVCKRWQGKNGFQNFYNDMGIRPKNKTLDRKDNNLGYCKSNCRWATPTEQANNRR